MPGEQSAMMLIVPVGATVVTVALRRRRPSDSRRLPLKLGNVPRVRASSADAAWPRSRINRMIRSPIASASALS